jgi:hypothetical protein
LAPAADGEVEDVDAVEDRLLDGGGGVGAVAAELATDLVGGDVGAGRHTREGAEVEHAHLGRCPGVAGSGAGGVGAVAVVVASRPVLVGLEAGEGLVGLP